MYKCHAEERVIVYKIVLANVSILIKCSAVVTLCQTKLEVITVILFLLFSSHDIKKKKIYF